MSNAPALSPIRTTRGIAGQLSATVTVTYGDEWGAAGVLEDPEQLTFVGNHYGGPVVMITPRGQVFVSHDVTHRIGFRFETNPEGWVRRFFG